MSSVTYPLVGGYTSRLTRLTRCGAIAYGNATQLVSDGFVSIAVTANYDDGEEVAVKNARGSKCVQRDADPELTNYGVAISFCGVDPDYYTAVTGMPKIVDPATGKTIGFKVNRGVRPSATRNCLEVWSEADGNGDCGDDDDVPFGYINFPNLGGARVADYTIENGAVSFNVTGMLTKDSSQWGEGPYEVVTDGTGAADVLQEAIEALDHMIVLRTTIAPPLPTGGLVPLDDPDGANATTATAGSPGTFNGVRPHDLVALRASAIAGSGGVTPWTTGQYVILGDGSYAHWLGSGATPKWGSGKKP